MAHATLGVLAAILVVTALIFMAGITSIGWLLLAYVVTGTTITVVSATFTVLLPQEQEASKSE